MQKIKCEICGSTDLIKQNGSFVCQSCGTAYSVEEAQKILQGQKVDVSGSVVKIDTKPDIAHLLNSAHLHLRRNNLWAAADAFETVLKKDSSNWEATFFSVYCASTDVSSVEKLNNNCSFL